MSTPPPIPPPLRAKSRPLLLWLFLGAALLAVLALGLIPGFYLVEKHRGRAAWRAYESEAKARGVQLDFAAYIPPEIPDAENFASIPIFDAAFRASDAKEPIPNPLKLPSSPDATLPKFSDPVKQEPIALAAWQKYFVEAKLLPAASDSAAADVLKALDTFTIPLAQLREAGARPHCRFPVHWEKAYAASLPHMELLQSASKLYALRLSAHLALGDSSAAYADFRDGLRLTTATTREPSLIAGLVRIANVVALENAVWGGLASHQWAEPELRKIEADLAALDWLTDGLHAIGSERGGSNLMIDMLIENPRGLAGFTAVDGPNAPSTRRGEWVFSLYPTGWFYGSKLRSNRYFDEMSARIEPGPRRWHGERAIPSSPEFIKDTPTRLRYMIFTIMAPVLESVEKRYVQAATVTDLARLACALERHRLTRGAFPQALSELTPDFLASLPAEIVNGEPYRYHRTDDGTFLLYSTGPDLRDDGGVIDPKTTASKQADWVWRYPQ